MNFFSLTAYERLISILINLGESHANANPSHPKRTYKHKPNLSVRSRNITATELAAQSPSPALITAGRLLDPRLWKRPLARRGAD